jgi:energy-coupling factor transport system substrate-specific component
MKALAASALGAGLFFWPFTGLGLPAELPALSAAIACVAALLLLELGTRSLDARLLALLAALAALDAGLRLALVTGIGGFSPVFFLILCGGFVFGASFGFLLGALALLVSAIVTGGIGPWLPYQMFAAGWVGLFAGFAGVAGRARRAGPGGREVVLLAAVGVLAGYGFGAAMDVWDWTFFRGSPGMGWTPGLPWHEAVIRFGRFYLVTSSAYDSFRAVGNALMVLVLGPAVLAALARIRTRLRPVFVADPGAMPTEPRLA